MANQHQRKEYKKNSATSNADQEAEDTSTDSQDIGNGILDDWDDFTEV